MAKVYFINEELNKHLDELQDLAYGARKRLKKSQKDMADVLGKSQQQYALDEKHIGKMRYEEVWQVMKELGFRVRIERE